MDFCLSGKFLVATPGAHDPHFSKTVVLVCNHDDQGAMGIVVNRRMETLSFSDLLENLDIDPTFELPDPHVYFGGPIDISHGFVIHTSDYVIETSLAVPGCDLFMTATVEILRAIGESRGPEQYLIALGYSGWAAGQLELEIQDNAWLVTDSQEDLLFEAEDDLKWLHTLAYMGVRSGDLSNTIGHA